MSQTEADTMKMVPTSRIEAPTDVYRALFKKEDPQARILGNFNPEQQREIIHKQQILSSLAYFIGKDFKIPVDLNEPGEGWHWDFQANRIRIDPQDLLSESMSKLRFKTSHEGGHRRISRTEGIPTEVWQQPGFSFLSNAIEDPRDNNFITEAYPRVREDMIITYQEDLDFEGQSKQQAKEQLGFQPRFITAGFEYIKQWFREVQGQPFELSADLDPEVRAVVEKTLESARDAWLRYPSKQEADDGGEPLIKKYAQVAYEIERDEIWPEFKKLVDQDMQDQETQELMQKMMNQKGKGEEQEGQGGLPQDLKDKLSEGQQQELQQAMDQAQQKAQSAGQPQPGSEDQPQQSDGEMQPSEVQPGQGQKRAVVDLDSLSPELKQKLKDHIDSQPQPTQQQIEEMAGRALKEIEDFINEQLQGKLSDNPDKKVERETTQPTPQQPVESQPPTSQDDRFEDPEIQRQREQFRDLVEDALTRDENTYEQARREVLPIIDELEADLREIFVQRRTSRWKSGFRTGKRIDIKKRMQEKVKAIPAVESKAWQRAEKPQEKDYAMGLLVDLSGSMQGPKINQTFRAAIALAEVLNRISINTEILGFNDRLYEYQRFGENMSQDIRANMGGMLQEVDTERARWNDDGWVLEQTALRLARQPQKEKFLFVLSDGRPEPSLAHSGSSYELRSMVDRITAETGIKVVGLGIGPGTEHVEHYYPSSVANIGVQQLPKELAGVIREAIENYDSF